MHDAGDTQDQVEQGHTHQQCRQGAADPEDIGGAQRGHEHPTQGQRHHLEELHHDRRGGEREPHAAVTHSLWEREAGQSWPGEHQ